MAASFLSDTKKTMRWERRERKGKERKKDHGATLEPVLQLMSSHKKATAKIIPATPLKAPFWCWRKVHAPQQCSGLPRTRTSVLYMLTNFPLWSLTWLAKGNIFCLSFNLVYKVWIVSNQQFWLQSRINWALNLFIFLHCKNLKTKLIKRKIIEFNLELI